LSLVLDSVDSTISDPILSGGLVQVKVVDDLLVSLGGLESVTSVLGEELFLGEVRELVEAHSVSLGNEIGGGDGEVVLVEDSKSEVLLRWGSVVLSVLVLPSGESGVDMRWDHVGVVGVGLVETSSDQQSGGNDGECDFVHFYKLLLPVNKYQVDL